MKSGPNQEQTGVLKVVFALLLFLIAVAITRLTGRAVSALDDAKPEIKVDDSAGRR